MSKRFYLILFLILTVAANVIPAQTIGFQLAFPNLTFVNPVDIQSANDGSDRIFVVEQAGRIKVFDNNASVTSAGDFLDIRSSVLSDDRFGMLGMTFHPNYAENGYFFVHYTAANPQRSVISRFSVSAGNPNIADPASELVLLEIGQPHKFHNGGQLAFGPQDGFLYIGMGDGGPGSDPSGHGQNRTTLLGSFLRINPDSSANSLNYSIPTDNPFVGNSMGYREETYAWGFRNPWRFSFDPVTGWLWSAGNGENLWEEIDLVEKGKNYGWKIMEGNSCFSPSTGCDTTGLVLPVWVYGGNPNIRRSVVGGFVYRGSEQPSLAGKYIYGDFLLGDIWALSYDGINPPENILIANNFPWLSTFGLDENGELLMADWINGQIYQFNPPTTIDEDMGQVLPEAFELDQNYPNPFNPSTYIGFRISKFGFVSLKIYDLSGKLIRALVNEDLTPGSYEMQWDGRNEAGVAMPSGVYFYRLHSGARSSTRRMILIR